MDLESLWMLKAQFLRQLLHVGPAFAIRFEDLKQDLKWISDRCGCSRHGFCDNFCMSDLHLYFHVEDLNQDLKWISNRCECLSHSFCDNFCALGLNLRS